MPTKKSRLFARFLLFGFLVMVGLLAVIGSWMWSEIVRWRFVGAAEAGDMNTFRAMLDKGMDPDIVTQIGGLRAISIAAYSGKTDVVRLLLERGANPTCGLPQAALMNRMDIVGLLLKRGADPTSGLPQAIMEKRMDIVRLLMAHGANVRHWQDYRESPLQFAQEQGNAKIVSLLKAAGAK